RASIRRVTALAVLSATWLLVLALRQEQGGGNAGETILGLLDAGFGRTSGLALVSIAAAAAAVSLVGLERILGWLAPLAALRVPPSVFRARFPHRPRPRPRTPGLDEPVILGPPTLPSGRS